VAFCYFKLWNTRKDGTIPSPLQGKCATTDASATLKLKCQDFDPTKLQAQDARSAALPAPSSHESPTKIFSKYLLILPSWTSNDESLHTRLLYDQSAKMPQEIADIKKVWLEFWISEGVWGQWLTLVQ
jgi:hypothetical protein